MAHEPTAKEEEVRARYRTVLQGHGAKRLLADTVDERAANVLLDLLVASQPEIEVGDARAWVSNIVGALPWEAGKQWAALRMLGHYLAICKTQPKPAGILSHAISRV